MTIDKKTVRLLALGCAVVSFVVYLGSIAPSVQFIDSGELSAVAYTFGIAHPTGYPLFTMLAGLWSRLPLGSVIFSLNVLSAFLCALAVGIFVFVLWDLFAHHSKPAGRSQKSKQKGTQQSKVVHVIPDSIRLTLAAFGAMFIGLSETFWSTALSIEVYSLHIFFIALLLFTALRAMPQQSVAAFSGRRWFAFCFVAGLSFTNHMTTILVVPGFLYLFFRTFGFKSQSWKKLLSGIPPFALGLLPYLYLPLRASSEPVLNWGNPQTWERFLWHVSGKQYRVWIFSSTEAAKRQFEYFISSFPGEFAYVGVLLVVVGLVYAFIRNSRTGWLLAILFMTCVAYSINYDIHDIDSYFLLAYIVAGIWAAYGLSALIGVVKTLRPIHVVAIAVVFIGASAGATFGRVSERDNYLVEDYTMNMFNSLKPHAIVLSYQWDYWLSASYYYQQVEGVRTDVVVIDKELLRRSWYLEQIRNNYPQFYRRSETEIRLFLQELDKFEHELPYNPEEIELRYNDMINSFVEKNYADHPVYFTIEMEKHLAPGYQRIPEGLALRLYKDTNLPSFDEKVWDDFAYRPFNRTGRLIDGLNTMYVNALTNRGIILHQAERYQEASRYFDRALKFDSKSMLTRQWKERNEQAMSLSVR